MAWIRTRKALLALCVASLVSQAYGDTIWNESTGGDLSGNRLAPSSAKLGVGGNDLFGTTQSGDVDYLTVGVPAGGQLTNLFLRSYGGNDSVAFIGVQRGTTFTEDPNSANPANLLGYAHFTRGQAGSNILSQIGSAFGTQQFTPPLPAGQYTFWIQQTGGSTTTYQFDFVTIPEPSSVALVAAGLSLLILGRRRIFRRSIKD